LLQLYDRGEGREEGLARSEVQRADHGRDRRVLVRIRESTGVPIGDVHKKSDGAADGFKTLHYAYEWEKAPLAAEDASRHTPQTILLFDTDETLRDFYRERTSAQVILVRPGHAFLEKDAQSFEIDPRSKDDFAHLLELLGERNYPIGDVCFAWTAARAEFRNEDVLEESLARGVTAFLYLCQAVTKAKLEGKIQLLYLYFTKPGEAQPHNEAVGGFLNTLRGESPRLLCKTIEVRQDAPSFDAI
jgi:hypothetical protein